MLVVLRMVSLIRASTGISIMFMIVFTFTLTLIIILENHYNESTYTEYDIVYTDYPLGKTNYSLSIDEDEIASKTLLIGTPTKYCSFNASFTNFNNNSWLSIGLINQGKYKYASFEKRYGLDFRAMTYNKEMFRNTLESDDNELSSDFILNEYYNDTESYHNYKIHVFNNYVNFYIDNVIVANITSNVPKNDFLYFHIQLSNMENNIPLEDAIYVEVKDIDVNLS